jgi:uncharacterized protein (TIGR01244 family)
MWPFSSAEPKEKKVNFKNIDKDYAVSGQILPDQMAAVSAAGFKSIVCARPDNEDHGQPSFKDVASAAEQSGIQIVHVPVSGMVSQGAFMRFEEAMKSMPKPVLAYCRSGGRAASLYQMLKRA